MNATTMSMSPQTAELFDKYVVPNYKRFPVALVRGEGSYVWDDRGAGIWISSPAGAATCWGTVHRGWSRRCSSRWPS